MLPTDRLYHDKKENIGCASGSEVTLFEHSGSGVVKTFWMAIGGGNTPVLDGRIRVYYDGSTLPTIDVDVATLFATHWGAQGSLRTPHMHVEINQSPLWTSFLFGFEIPFYSGITIAFFNPANGQNAGVYSQVAYNLYPDSSLVPWEGQRLRASCKRYKDQAVTRIAAATSVLLDVAGTGSIVYMAYVGGVNASNDTWMERNFGIFIDGEVQPSILSSGTEDWFDSGWYYSGWKNCNTSVHCYVGTDKPSAQPHCVGQVVDLQSKWEGIPFGTSAKVLILPESACTTDDTFCYAVLYYQ